jgi:hypothetical protein
LETGRGFFPIPGNSWPFLIVSRATMAYNARLMHIVFRNGLTAARKNLGPGLLLQGFALAMVLLYYFNPTIHQQLLKIPEIRQRLGIFFPMLGTAFFGGVIPFVFMAVRRDIVRRQYVPQLLFLTGFWAINGVLINLLYQLQTALFGDSPTAVTIVKKVLVDQFVFSVFWSAPFAAVAMKWKQCGFSFRETREQLSFKTLSIEVPTVLISLWGVWIPAVAIVYSLPLALQFPLFNIVLCFWSLLLTALNQGEARDIDYQPTAVCPN